MSLASIFIRLAQAEGLPSLVIAAGRVSIATVLLTPLALARYHGAIRGLNRRDLALSASAGFFLALHFATWISSLEYTSVLISVVFVTTNPLWVALLEFSFFKTRLSRAVLIGLALAVGGGILIGLTGEAGSAGSNPVLGALLALAGAIAFAVYLVIGRGVRSKLPLIPYIWLVYGWAAIFLLVVVVIGRLPVTGYSAQGYFWLVAMAIFAQLIGHSSFNYALGYLSATFIGISTQMESIGGAVAAFVLFGEKPLPLQIVGSLIILLGVGMATLGQQQPLVEDA